MAIKAKPKRGLVWAAVSTRPQADDDKFSIPKQIEDGTKFCEDNGIEVIDVLVVPGHSRTYRQLDKLAEHARSEKIDAFDRLIEHFNRSDFDVFVCRDANRFARRASLLHYIAETIVEDCHASIYDMANALWVNESNVDMWATMQGFKTRSEVKALVRMTKDGLMRRAERGLTTTRVPFSHRLIRDEKLRPIRVEVDETKRRLFNDLAALLLDEKHGFNGIEKTLFERFGHAGEDGNPYGDNIMYTFLYNPLTWGATTYGVDRRDKGRSFGTWVYDGSDPPEGVTIHRNKIEPVYSGQLAERIKAELTRRKQMIGTRRPQTSRTVSGLFVCGSCGRALGVRSSQRKGERYVHGLRCGSNTNKFTYKPYCPQSTKTIPIDYFHDYLDDLLRRLIATRDFSEIVSNDDQVGDERQLLGFEINTLTAQLDKLIAIQAKAHDATQERYQARIDAIGEQLERLIQRDRMLETQSSRYETDLRTAQRALDNIEAVWNGFWSLDEPTINQHLHALMSNRRFMVLNGEIQKTIPAPRYQRRKPRKANRKPDASESPQ